MLLRLLVGVWLLALIADILIPAYIGVYLWRLRSFNSEGKYQPVKIARGLSLALHGFALDSLATFFSLLLNKTPPYQGLVSLVAIRLSVRLIQTAMLLPALLHIIPKSKDGE